MRRLSQNVPLRRAPSSNEASSHPLPGGAPVPGNLELWVTRPMFGGAQSLAVLECRQSTRLDWKWVAWTGEASCGCQRGDGAGGTPACWGAWSESLCDPGHLAMPVSLTWQAPGPGEGTAVEVPAPVTFRVWPEQRLELCVFIMFPVWLPDGLRVWLPRNQLMGSCKPDSRVCVWPELGNVTNHIS